MKYCLIKLFNILNKSCQKCWCYMKLGDPGSGSKFELVWGRASAETQRIRERDRNRLERERER